MIINGSHALPFRETPNDVDLICTLDEIRNLVAEGKRLGRLQHAAPINAKKYLIVFDDVYYEIEMALPGSTAESFLSLIEQHPELTSEKTYTDMLLLNVPVVTTDVAYTFKMSHRFLKNSPFFEKTHTDIVTLRCHPYFAKIPEVLAEWYDARVVETYDYKHPSLMRTKAEFFDTPGVTYKYDHDSIHEAVKLGERPAYTYFKADQAEVFCDRELFEKQPFTIKLNSVLEESYVLAIERSMVPFNCTTSSRDAFIMALQKVCTSITSGWWRDWAWEHYAQAKEAFDPAYMERFMDGLMNGTIKLHNR